MENVLNKEKLEESLVKNWPQFFDRTKLMACVVQNVRNNLSSFSYTHGEFIQPKIQISLSRFSWEAAGFLVWVEFVLPVPDGVANGTVELLFAHTGKITQTNISGNIKKKKLNHV